MRDELFDHLKHRLAETEVPDPGQGWQLMSAMLDATARPRPVVQLRRWYVAAACLILAGAAWAIVHEVRSSSSDRRREATSLTAPGSGIASGSAPDAGSVPGTTPGTTAPGTSAPTRDAQGATRDLATGKGAEADGATSPAGISSPSGTTSPSGTASLPGAHGAMAAAHITDTRTANTGVTNAGSAHTSAAAATGTTAPSPDGVSLVALTQKASLAPAEMHVESSKIKNTLLRERPLVAALRPMAPTTGPLRPARHSRWGLDIGLGANFPGSMRTITVNNQARWEPGLYPVINARYRLTPRLSLKAGVAAPSPVAYTKTLSQKSLTVYDSAVMAYARPISTSSTKIGRLLYADIPVSLQWAVIRHLNLEAGIQYSRLLSQQDDTRSSTQAAGNFTTYYAPSVISSTAQTVKTPTPQVKRSDIRYLLGANFTWHRFSAGLEYQGGLQHSANQMDDQGNTINSHTSIAKMQLMYSLR